MLLCITEPSLFLTEAILVTFSLNLIFSFFHSFSHSFTSPPNFNYRIHLLNSAKLVNVPKINFGLCTRTQTLRICYNLSLQTCLERLDIKGNTCLHNVNSDGFTFCAYNVVIPLFLLFKLAVPMVRERENIL